MTISVQANKTFTIGHSFTFSNFMSSHRITAPNRQQAAPRRTSPVLSTQELRQIVLQMVG